MRGSVRILASIALAVVLAASSAGAQETVFIDVWERAGLKAGGGAVDVLVRIACPSEPSGGIQENRLEVRQLQRGTLVVAVGGTGDLTCDGNVHPYVIRAHVQEPTHRLRRGPAEANMFVLICDEAGAACIQGDVTEAIVIAGP